MEIEWHLRENNFYVFLKKHVRLIYFLEWTYLNKHIDSGSEVVLVKGQTRLLLKRDWNVQRHKLNQSLFLSSVGIQR